MALGSGSTAYQATIVSNSSRTRSNSAFIPEKWSDEILAAYKANLIMSALVNTLDFNGQKGDTIHLPKPVRHEAGGSALSHGTGTTQAVVRALTSEAELTPVRQQSSVFDLQITQHWVLPMMIEDIVTIQAEDSKLRSFLTDDAGYQLARVTDAWVWQNSTNGGMSRYVGAHASDPYTIGASNYVDAKVGALSAGALVTWDPAANTNTGNAAHLTEEAIRRFLRELDDNDVPSRGRVLVVPPVEKEYLLGISRFTEQAFVGEAGAANSIRNGRVGNVFGVEVYVSSNAPTVSDSTPTADQRACVLFQKDSYVFVEQMRPRIQNQYKLEFLGELIVADTVFDGKILRPEGGISIIVPSN